MSEITEAVIEADPRLPIIRMTRDFAATPEQLLRAHTDPEIFARWVGPDGMQTKIIEWDARNGGGWRYVAGRDGEEYGFRGCFHEVSPDRIVQTFTFEGMPRDVALETLTFEDLGGGRTRLHAQSLVDTFEGRDAWLCVRHGDRRQRGLRQARRAAARWDCLSPPRGPEDPGLTGLGPAERHRRVAGAFTDRVAGTRDWAAPAPVPGWSARDVVGHLVGWLPGFLAAGGVTLPAGPPVEEDPVAAWRGHASAVQALLDDPDTAGRGFTHPMIGEHPLAEAIDMFYTADVFMHTWDLARATGQDDRLDPGLCAVLLAGMEPMEDAMRSSGHYGPRVPVPDDADVQARLLGFIGRDPAWVPPGGRPRSAGSSPPG